MRIEKQISKSFKFEASHRLAHLQRKSPCKNLHGHSFKARVIITADLNDEGMIIDFSELKKFQDYLDEVYDHALILYKETDSELRHQPALRDSKWIEISDPVTAENLSEHLCKHFHSMFKNKINNLKRLEMQVWETENNYANTMMDYRE